MAQKAQEEPIKVEITGGFADMTADQKKYLKDCIARKIIMDVELVSTTQGTSRIVSHAKTTADSVDSFFIVAVNSVASTPALVRVALQ